MRYFIMFACGLLVALALLPGSSWVFKDLADEIRYGRTAPQYSESDPSDGSDAGVNIAPFKNLADPSLVTVNDPKAELARGMLETETNAAIQRLLRYSRANPDDPVGWANLLRTVCVAGTFSKVDSPKEQPEGYAQSHYFPAMEAVQNGTKADPDNAFFPLIGACVDSEAGDPESARVLLLRASKCTTYNDWIKSAVETELRLFEAQWGFRGNWQRVRLEGAVPLPHLAHVKKLARTLAAEPEDKDGLQEREELFRIDSLMLRHARGVIGMLVALNCNGVLLGQKGFGSSNPLTEEKRLQRDERDSAAIEAAMRTAGVDVSGASPIKIVGNRVAITKSIHDYVNNVGNPMPFVESSTRLGTILLPIMMAISASIGLFCLILRRIKGRLPWGFGLAFVLSLLAVSGTVLVTVTYDNMLAQGMSRMMIEGDQIRSEVSIQS